MKKIGIFGSSFNPLHLGHLIMMDQSIERLDLDLMIMIPTKNPYHKKTDVVDFSFRYKMAVIEAEKHDRIVVSDLEESFEGKSYTFNVLEILEQSYPNSQFYFIMGSDNLLTFKEWYRAEDLIKKCSYIVFQRPEDEDVSQLVEDFRQMGMDVHFFDDLQFEISSTFIRNSIKKGNSVRYLLTKDVIDFIKENGLYE